jgi:hypothetical protein
MTQKGSVLLYALTLSVLFITATALLFRLAFR